MSVYGPLPAENASTTTTYCSPGTVAKLMLDCRPQASSFIATRSPGQASVERYATRRVSHVAPSQSDAVTVVASVAVNPYA